MLRLTVRHGSTEALSHNNGDYNVDHNGDYNADHNGDYNADHNGDYNVDHNGDYNVDYNRHDVSRGDEREDTRDNVVHSGGSKLGVEDEDTTTISRYVLDS